MSAPIPTTEPSTIRAGDLLVWTKSLSDYPANDGWTLAYTLINATTKISIATSASGADFAVSVAAATTANYAAGLYQWTGRVTKATEIYTVGTGTVEVLANVAALSTFDFRSHARVMLEAIEAAYEGRASVVQLEYEINGRRVRHMTPAELIEWRSFYQMEVAQEAAADTLARTGINTRRIGVRFTRV